MKILGWPYASKSLQQNHNSTGTWKDSNQAYISECVVA